MTINSRDWVAQEKQQDFAGGPWMLTVTGEVELPQPMRAVVMRQIFPEDMEPSIIALEVVPLGDEIGADVMTWHKVGFLEEGMTEPEYEVALIFYAGGEITKLEIDIIPS